MHFDKFFDVRRTLPKDGRCDEAFTELLDQILALPPEIRGARALNLSARLVELAAYELAMQTSSDKVGELIECAAELSEHSVDAAESALTAAKRTGHYTH